MRMDSVAECGLPCFGKCSLFCNIVKIALFATLSAAATLALVLRLGLGFLLLAPNEFRNMFNKQTRCHF